MNYGNLYYKFIEKFKSQEICPTEYTEVHHILPRYKGGSDEDDNLVRLTFKQHLFVHHLWARHTNDPEAWFAYKMMKGVNFDHRREYARLGGIKNVKSGHLDRIRCLANTPERQKKLRELHVQLKADGRLQKCLESAWEANRGRVVSEEEKLMRSKIAKERFMDSHVREKQQEIINHAKNCRLKALEELAKNVVENAQCNQEWLDKTSRKSKNKFISPEGLVFDSPLFAAKYYGNVTPHNIENWCKRGHHGWSRIPKEV